MLFANGPSGLNDEQMSWINKYGIPVVETGLKELYHREGYLYAVALQDGRQVALSALFTRADWKQASSLAEELGCALDEQGYIITDDTNQTTVPGIFAAGDNSGKFRSLSTAVSSGTLAGAFINRSLIFSLVFFDSKKICGTIALNAGITRFVQWLANCGKISGNQCILL